MRVSTYQDNKYQDNKAYFVREYGSASGLRVALALDTRGFADSHPVWLTYDNGNLHRLAV